MKFTESESGLLCQCVARSIRQSVRLRTGLPLSQSDQRIRCVFQSVYNKEPYSIFRLEKGSCLDGA